MIRRLSAITAWLTAGHAVLFALFWLLLAVPESNAFMLVASALVIAAMAIVFGIVEGAALLAWPRAGQAGSLRDTARQAGSLPHRATSLRHAARAAWRALPGIWLGAVLFLLVWLLTSRLDAWWNGHRGEVDAWFMAEFGLSETAKLHLVAESFFRFLYYVVGVSLAESLASVVVRDGLRPAARASWVRGALAPKRLATIAAILMLFVWLPWQAVNWRPAVLAPNWQESLFVAAKLGGLFLIVNLGWALVLGAATYRTWSQGTPLER